MDLGSDLCLRCGICCRGVLDPDALLDEDERPKAERYALTIVDKYAGQAVFGLPCNRHDHATNGCTIYDTRFRVCRRYACDLLRTLREGGIGLNDAQRIATSVRDLESGIYDRIGGYDPSRTIWQQLTSFLAADAPDGHPADVGRHAELLVQARLLSMLCNRHFEYRMHKRLNADAPRHLGPPLGDASDTDANVP
jgi:uncharacterized protein